MSQSQIRAARNNNRGAVSQWIFFALTTLAVIASFVIGSRAWQDGRASCPSPPKYFGALAILGSGLFTLAAATLFPRVRGNMLPKVASYLAYPAAYLSFLFFLLAMLIVAWNVIGSASSFLYGRMAGRRLVLEEDAPQFPKGSSNPAGFILSSEWHKEEAAQKRYFDTPWAVVAVWHGAWIRDARDKLESRRREVENIVGYSSDDREVARKGNEYLAAVDCYARLSSLFISAAIASMAGVFGWFCNRMLWSPLPVLSLCVKSE